MKASLPVILVLLLIVSAEAQRSFAASINSHRRHIEVVQDPITEAVWRSVRMDVSTYRGGYISTVDETASLQFVHVRTTEDDRAYLKLLMRSGIGEWPIRKEAYLIIDRLAHPITLNNAVNSSVTIDEVSASEAECGNRISSVATSDYQIIKKEAEITKLITEETKFESVQLVIYSGRKPLVFKFTPNDVNKIHSLFK